MKWLIKVFVFSLLYFRSLLLRHKPVSIKHVSWLRNRKRWASNMEPNGETLKAHQGLVPISAEQTGRCCVPGSSDGALQDVEGGLGGAEVRGPSCRGCLERHRAAFVIVRLKQTNSDMQTPQIWILFVFLLGCEAALGLPFFSVVMEIRECLLLKWYLRVSGISWLWVKLPKDTLDFLAQRWIPSIEALLQVPSMGKSQIHPVFKLCIRGIIGFWRQIRL